MRVNPPERGLVDDGNLRHRIAEIKFMNPQLRGLPARLDPRCRGLEEGTLRSPGSQCDSRRPLCPIALN